MAINNEVNITVQWIDKATKPLKKIKGSFSWLSNSLEKYQSAFQKMAGIWAAAFWWLAVWINKATQVAAEDEGTWNKFATVFAEWTDEMNNFVNDLRTRMPVATGTIQRMAADLQDLLVPIWLSREMWAEMTQGFLEVSNAIGAFNDVNPSEVLEAIKSGLTWSSEPLKRFWVDASVTALEVRALEMWLLDAGQKLTDLEPEVQNQIKAQALLQQVTEQSSDAIGWFEENSDSLMFRQMELKATMEDLSWELWKVFIPIIDNVVKSIQPVVENITKWVWENQELAKNIAIWVAALTWLIAVFWTLWLVLPSIITWFTSFITVIKGLWIALRFLALNPIGLVITAIAWGIAIWVAIVKNWETIKSAATSLWQKIIEVYEKYKILFAIFTPIIAIWIELIKNWDKIKETLSTVWQAIEKTLKNMWAWLYNLIQEAKDWGRNLIDMLISWIKEKAKAVTDAVKWIATTISDFLWFHSPTKKWPASDSDKWMPNLINMMESWLKNGKGKFSRAAAELSTVLVNEFWKTWNFEKIQGVLDNLQIQFQQSFQWIKSNIDSSKANIQGLTNEIKGLEDQLKRVDESMAALDASTEKSVAERVVELEKQLQSWDLSREEEVAKQKELDFAREKTTLEEIQAIKDYQALNETERILYQAELRREQFEEEKMRIQEELDAKEDALSKELDALADLYAQKNTLEREYHSLYMTNIDNRILKTKESIALLERLNAMRESALSGSSWVDWARALWWTVNSWKTYLVWERWPELFTPSTTWNITPNNELWWQSNNITINMWWVVVQNEADEDRLIEKIKRSLTNDLQMSKLGIS